MKRALPYSMTEIETAAADLMDVETYYSNGSTYATAKVGPGDYLMLKYQRFGSSYSLILDFSKSTNYAPTITVPLDVDLWEKTALQARGILVRAIADAVAANFKLDDTETLF